MLERQRVRTDVTQRLLAAGTDCEDRIFRGRATNVGADECPATCVNTPRDGGDNEDRVKVPTFKGKVTVQLDNYVAAAEGWDDKVDAICEQNEQALLQNPDFMKEFEMCASYTTDISFLDGGETRIAVAIQKFEFEYTDIFEPTVGDDFAEIGVEVDAVDPFDRNIAAKGPDGVIEAGLELEMEQ